MLTPLAIPPAPGFKGNFEKIIFFFFKIEGKTISIPAWDKLYSHGGSNLIAAMISLPKESMTGWEASKWGDRPIDKGVYFKHTVCGRSWPPRLFFWDAFQLRNTMPVPASASFSPHGVEVQPQCQPPIACQQYGDEQVNTNPCLGVLKSLASRCQGNACWGKCPLPSSRAHVAESPSKEPWQLVAVRSAAGWKSSPRFRQPVLFLPRNTFRYYSLG